jgi:hypothetical protein
MGKAKGRTRQNRRLVEMPSTEPQVEDTYWQGDPDGSEDYEYTIEVPPLGRFLGRQRLDSSGRLIEFSLSAQIDLGNRDWRTIARGCSEHGEVHVHHYRIHGEQYDRTLFKKITCHADVDAGYDYVENWLTERWEDLVRGCWER